MGDTLLYLAVVLPLAAVTGVLARRRNRSFWLYFLFCALIPVGSLVAIPHLLSRRSERLTRDVDARRDSAGRGRAG
jgi:hypothetical protein